MAVISALRRAVETLVSTPVLFVGGVAYGGVVAPQTFLLLLGVPAIPTVLQVVTFFITPFVLAGVVGMAAEGLDGPTSFQTMVAVGTDRYLPYLLGTIVELAIRVVLGVLAFVVFFVVGIVVIGSAIGAAGAGVGGGTGGGLAGGLLGAIGILGIAAIVIGVLFVATIAAVVFLFIQFYPIVIVVDGAGVVDSFRRSVSFVWSNLAQTVGFSVVNFTIGLLTSLPIVAFVLLQLFSGGGSAPAPTPTTTPAPAPAPTGGAGVSSLLSTTEAVALGALSLFFTVVLIPFRMAYATAFYRTLGSG